MSKCCAEVLGDCSSGSGEHPISQGIFEQDMIYVEGPAWLKDQRKVLPKASLVAGILCEKHNNDTSHLDAIASKVAAATRTLFTSNTETALTIDGFDYERWCLKSLINLAVSGWMKDGKAGPPPKEYVEIVFRNRKLKSDAGLYVFHELTGITDCADRCQWTVLGVFGDMRGIIIGINRFLGVLSLSPHNAPADVRAAAAIWPEGVSISHPKARYRPRTMEYVVNEVVNDVASQTSAILKIRFTWPGGRFSY
jgi:hypothetical protein